MRAEITAGRPNAEGPPSEEPYEPDHVAGFTSLRLTPADAALAQRVFGTPCAGFENIWAVPVTAFDFENPEDVYADFALVMRPMVMRLPDGRDVLLAPTMPGDAHATVGFQGALILGGQQRKPFPMDGGGTFGYPGSMSVPIQQPLGAFHVWLEGGGTWQGYTQGWAAITDFSGSVPRDLGSFRISAYFPCGGAMGHSNTVCTDGREYSLASVSYSDNGPDELTLQWTLQTFSEDANDRRFNARARTFTARYELRGGKYQLIEGEEPPSV